jgi:hypothetical protein
MLDDLNRSLGRIHALARGAVAFIWLYHGIVPKLLFRHPDELELMTAGGLAPRTAGTVVALTGWAEVLFAVLLLATWRWRWGMLANIGLMLLASVIVAVNVPRFLVAAFNPVSLNASIVALSAIAFIAQSAQAGPRNRVAKAPEIG